MSNTVIDILDYDWMKRQKERRKENPKRTGTSNEVRSTTSMQYSTGTDRCARTEEQGNRRHPTACIASKANRN